MSTSEASGTAPTPLLFPITAEALTLLLDMEMLGLMQEDKMDALLGVEGTDLGYTDFVLTKVVMVSLGIPEAVGAGLEDMVYDESLKEEPDAAKLFAEMKRFAEIHGLLVTVDVEVDLVNEVKGDS